MMDSQDLKRLKWPIAFLVMLSALGGGSVWSALELQKSSEKAVKDANAARADIRAKLDRAREEQAELRDKIGRFQALKSRGYIGPEHRLDWVEAISRIRVANRVFKVDYDFAPQRPVDATILPGGASAGGYEFMASQMRMQVQLLHEGELLALLDDLRKGVQALLQIRACSMARIPTGPQDRGNHAQVKADCTLEWITLREAK